LRGRGRNWAPSPLGSAGCRNRKCEEAAKPLLLSEPMIWLSILLVFGTLASIGVNLTSDSPGLQLGAGLIIRGRIPWILLGLLWGGVALGVASLFRGRRLPKLGVLLLEIAPVAFVSWYVMVGSVLPAHALRITVGDPFPAYALQDQDGTLHERAALEKRPPALYVFYRGHW
jgi:hypothetical protein